VAQLSTLGVRATRLEIMKTKKENADMTNEELDSEYEDAAKRKLEASGALAYQLHVRGNRLAKRLGYKKHSGMEAIYFYLVERHHWLPSQVRSLSWDDLWFLTDDAMPLPSKEPSSQIE
jgi:hypothetical protein